MASASNLKTRNKSACPIFGQGSDLDNRVLPTYYEVLFTYLWQSHA